MATETMTVQQLDPRRLIQRRDQAEREYAEEEFEALVESVRAQGVQTPLTVRELPSGEVEIIAGHHRAAAAIRAGVSEVPCVVRQLDDTTAAELVLLDNLLRQDLQPWEEGAAYLDLHSRGLSYAAIAQRSGRRVEHVRDRVKCADTCEAIRKMYLRKELTLASLMEIASLPNEVLGVRYCTCGEVNPEAAESCVVCGRNLAEEQVIVQDNPQEAAARLCRDKTARQVSAVVELLRRDYGLKASQQTGMDFGNLFLSPEAVKVREKTQNLLSMVSRLGDDVIQHPEAITRLPLDQREAIIQQAEYCKAVLAHLQEVAS